LNPLALDPLFWQAQALVQLGDFQGARQLYIEGVKLQPLNWKAWYYLGKFESGQQDYGRGLPALKRAVALDPQGSQAQEELAKVTKLAP
jgi:tetratricopeptide (TPR) repeat protein